MSISSRIWDIDSHLLDDYSVLELAGSDLTNVNKNVVNLKPTWRERLLYFMNNGTDIVWNNWNKVTGSGTTLSINGTVQAPMSLVYKGQTSQTGTPTPESPQDIHVVSGDNSIKVCGKNLIGLINGTYSNNQITAVVNNGEITLNGTANGTSFVVIPFINNISLSNQTITVSTNNETAGGDSLTEMRVYTEGSAYLACSYNIINNSTVYTNKTGTYTKLQIRTSSGVSYSNFKLKPMLELGNQATTYEPYQGSSYPISLGDKELCKIGTYQDKIDKSSGKNLFDISSTLDTLGGGWTLNNNTLQWTGTTGSSVGFFQEIFIDIPSGIYTISGAYSNSLGLKNATDVMIRIRDANRTAKSTSYTATYDKSNGDLFSLLFYKNKSNATAVSKTITETFTNIMLNEGTTALPYEPYGTGWYLKKEIGKVVLDGVNFKCNYVYNTPSSSFNVYDTANSKDVRGAKYNEWEGEGLILCDRLKGLSARQLNSNVGVTIYNQGEIRARLSTTETLTVAQVNEILQTNNYTIYYVLATPIYTEITDTTLLGQLEAIKKSYHNQTNISQENNDLPFELDVVALGVM